MTGWQVTAMATASDIYRGRTAMSRTMLSRPLQQAFADGLLDHGDIFDYGCGRGDDLKTLGAIGLVASGWDPAHRPEADRCSASIVNLGYVINVIEDLPERATALRGAWDLTKSALVVAARLTWDQDANAGRPFGDGYITSTGTFQKYYTHEELKAWIESVLGEPAITAAPGICYVFRDKGSAQQLLARNTRRSTLPRRGVAELLVEQHRDTLTPLEEFVSTHRRLPTPTEIEKAAELVDTFGSIRGAFLVIRHATGAHKWPDIDLGTKKRSTARFEENLEDLQPLIDFVNERGRLPRSGELDNEAILDEQFGSPRAAFSLIRRVTGPAAWEAVEHAAMQNFLVYAALAAFGGRPKFSELPDDLQYDAKDLFGSYTNACKSADRLLHSIADNAAINEACTSVPFGKLMPEALYVHVNYVSELPPVLRVYEGAARQITGNVDDATLVKINRVKPQVSFLVYPDFDSDPHPTLHASIVAKLGEIRMKHRYFGNSANPPILHRKDSFLPETHPDWKKYNRLSRQEERAGLLDRPDIGTRDGWAHVLAEAGYALHGHQLRRLQASEAGDRNTDISNSTHR
jgi:hypothetical protein